MNELLERLHEPFPPSAITWKPGATTKDGTKCMAMAYGDLRTYMERLDEVCGLDWSVRYEPWGNERIIACVTIAGVTRSSIGEYGKQDEQNNIEGTVAEAQAFKRACAMFGLGRYLYDLPSVWVPFDAGAKKITAEGQAQLDTRYKAWYAKTMAELKRQNAPTSPQQAHSATQGNSGQDNPFEDNNAPTAEEIAQIKQWANRTEAEMWAVMTGACKNEHHARESMDKSIAKYGGKVTKENYQMVYVDFLRHQREKLAQPVAA